MAGPVAESLPRPFRKGAQPFCSDVRVTAKDGHPDFRRGTLRGSACAWRRACAVLPEGDGCSKKREGLRARRGAASLVATRRRGRAREQLAVGAVAPLLACHQPPPQCQHCPVGSAARRGPGRGGRAGGARCPAPWHWLLPGVRAAAPAARAALAASAGLGQGPGRVALQAGPASRAVRLVPCPAQEDQLWGSPGYPCVTAV